MIAEVVHVSKRKKARPYTLGQKSFTAAELAFWEKRYHAKDIEFVPGDSHGGDRRDCRLDLGCE